MNPRRKIRQRLGCDQCMQPAGRQRSSNRRRNFQPDQRAGFGVSERSKPAWQHNVNRCQCRSWLTARNPQPVFARYLNVSKNLVSDWERGAKRPGGPALRLLTVVRKSGLRAIA